MSKLRNVVLFLKDEETFKMSCHTMVAPSSILPQVSHFIDGLWLVDIKKLLTFVVVCLQKEMKTIHLNPPSGMTQLNISCTAKSDYLTLLPHYN